MQINSRWQAARFLYILFRMTTVLITGANGLVGQKASAAFSRRSGWKVIASSLSPAKFSFPNGTFEKMDITSPESVKAAFEKYRPDILLHCAAFTDVNRAESEKERCWEINVDGVANLILACQKLSTRLIHLSTDFIFDGKAGPYRETDKPNPLSYYGKSKEAAEELVKKSGLHWTIVRTCLIYGITEQMTRSNIVLWVKKSLEERKPIRVVLDQVRTPTLAEDLAEGLIAVIEKQGAGLYHMAGHEPMSIYEMAGRIAVFWKLDRSLISPVLACDLNEPAARPAAGGLVISKAINDLGYQTRSLQESFELIDRQIKH